MKITDNNKDAEVYVNHYDWNGYQLLYTLMRACAKAGSRGKEIETDFHTVHKDLDALTAFYLRSVILAKLEGQKPPFQPGDKVFATCDHRVFPSNGHISDTLMAGEFVQIIRVYYGGCGTWCVEIARYPGLFYSAEDFTPVPPTDNLPDDAA